MISIDEIILQLRKGNKEAIELLFCYLETYIKNIEKKMIYSFNYPMNMREDLKMFLKQVSINIVDTYEMDKGHFIGYWKMLVMQHVIKHYNNLNNEFILINKSVELDSVKLDFWDIASDEPLERYEAKNEYERILEDVSRTFDSRCSMILKLWSEGYSYEYIADYFNVSRQVVTYSIYKTIKFLKSTNGKNDK